MEKGFPVPPTTLNDAVSVKDIMNCSVQTEEGEKYVLVKRKGDASKEFLDSIEVYTDAASLPDGLYCWILTDPGKFAAIQVLSALEVGSIHKTITHKLGVTKIHGAGEMRKDKGGLISYNLLSGTYMNEWLASAEACRGQLESEIRTAFERLFPGVLFGFVTKTLISQKLRLTKKELERYARYGFIVTEFDDPKECIKARDEEKNRQAAQQQAVQQQRAKEAIERMKAAQKQVASGKTRRRRRRRRQTRRR
jgi:hypothetical protein